MVWPTSMVRETFQFSLGTSSARCTKRSPFPALNCGWRVKPVAEFNRLVNPAVPNTVASHVISLSSVEFMGIPHLCHLSIQRGERMEQNWEKYPTAAEINALPAKVRVYIHDLETRYGSREKAQTILRVSDEAGPIAAAGL